MTQLPKITTDRINSFLEKARVAMIQGAEHGIKIGQRDVEMNISIRERIPLTERPIISAYTLMSLLLKGRFRPMTADRRQSFQGAEGHTFYYETADDLIVADLCNGCTTFEIYDADSVESGARQSLQLWHDNLDSELASLRTTP
jgi:hypothetical protein